MNRLLIAVVASCTFALPALAAENDVRGACASDIKSFCANVQTGEGRIRKCMKEHRDELSSGCKDALANQAKAGHARRRGGAGAEKDGN
jgi:hypothetical protein